MTEKIAMGKPLIGKTVLVIEDDHFISKVYLRWLTLAGATVEVAYNGALGLELLTQTKVDLILLDLGMPGLNGCDTLQELRKNETTKNIPVIILSNTTVKEGTPTFDELTKAGVTDILRKYETSLEEIVEKTRAYFPESKV